MASVNGTSELNGFFKQVYADKFKDLLPTSAILQKLIPFQKAEQIGANFNTPVLLQFEHGIVYGAADSTLTLPTPITGAMKNAQVPGYQIAGSSRINYEALYKAMDDAKNGRAFGNSLNVVVKNLINSMAKRLEISLLWGQSGIATLSAVSGAGTTRTWTITTAEWSSGIWAGMVGASLDAYSSGGTQRNTNALIEVTAVDHDAKTVSVSGNAADLTAIVATDVLFFRSGSSTTEMVGLHKILSNTSTSLFGISPTTYPLWAGNVYASTTTPTMAKVLAANAKSIAFGLEDEVTLLASPEAFVDLNSELAALRMFDSSYKAEKGESGVESIVYHGQAGKLHVVAHPFQKLGYMHIIPHNECKRIGATDLTFRKHGKNGDELILEVAGEGSAEMRVYGNQAVFCEAPRHGCAMTGVTP